MNLPNKLSLLRIFMIPIMVVFYFLDFPCAPLISAIIFILASATDFLDGYIARKYNMVTDLGKLLDPIADKMLVMFALFMVVESNTLPIIFASVCCAIIVSRELLISAIRQIAAAKGSVIMANKFGKIKTIFQDIALPVLLLLKMKDALISISQTFYDCIYYIGLVTFIIATLLTIISGIVYIVQNKGVFASND